MVNENVVSFRSPQSTWGLSRESWLGRVTQDYLFTFITICFAGFAAYTVYQGANAFLSSKWEQAIMAGASLGLELGLYLYLHYAYPYASPAARRKMLVGILLAVPFIFCLSTIMGTVFFGGGTAIKNAMNRNVEASETELVRLHGELKGETSLQQQLDTLSRQFAALAQSEAKGGLTGSAGTGSVSATISSVSSMLAQMKNAVTESQQKIDAKRRELEEKLIELRRIAYSPNGHGTLTTEFGTKLSEFNTMLAEMQALSAKSTVNSLASQLANIAAVSTTTGSGNAALATRQMEAIVNVRDATLAAQGTIAKVTSTRSTPVKVQTFSAGEIFESIFSNMSLSMWIAFLLAIAIDFAPLLFLFLKTIMVNDREGRYNPPSSATPTSAT